MAAQPARDPDGEIDVAGERWRFRAEEVEDERRERIWQEALRTYPGFSAYAKRAAPRRISVFVLEPRSEAARTFGRCRRARARRTVGA